MRSVADLARWVADRRAKAAAQTYVVGVTGGVAAGKSTLAGELARALDPLAVEVVGSDGFLFDNATLAEAGLTLRKGVPESYDRETMASALQLARAGKTRFPGYSHSLYDVDPSLAREVDRPGVLIIEGLGLGHAPVDALIYVEAEESLLEAWFLNRFMGLWQGGRSDPSSFYARFSGMTEEQAAAFALQVWREINLPNVREHIIPLRERADAVVIKGAGHHIQAITTLGAL